MEDKMKKILAGVSAVAIAVAGFGAGSFMVEPETIVTEKIVNVPFIVNHTIEVPVEKIVNLTTEVLVDNGKLDLVLEHIYDNNGDVEYLIDDLDDDEISEIADRVVFINDIKFLAAQEVNNEIKDLLDKESFNGTDRFFDEDDIERVRVQDDADELIIEDVDFEDKDADVRVEVRFEQDDIKYNAFVTVEFKDGSVDDINLESIELRD